MAYLDKIKENLKNTEDFAVKTISFFLILTVLAAMLLSGCRGNTQEPASSGTQSTAPSTQTTSPSAQMNSSEPLGAAVTRSAKILSTVWQAFGEDQRFSVYGGAIENAVDNGPGDLDITDTEELTTRYLLPENRLEAVKEGASLVHMMNSNIFTGVVFCLTDSGTVETLAKQWRDTIQGNRWICGMPDRLLLASVDSEHLLMAFGSKEILTVFQEKLSAQYPQTRILYQEPVVS